MLCQKHKNEWLASAVAPELIDLNVVSLFNAEAYDRLLYALPLKERRNDGRLRDKWLRRYAHCESGGWWVSGTDILTSTVDDDLWGQFKPDCPILSFDRRKTVKYEAPPKESTGIFACKVSLPLWQAISRRFNVALPERIEVDESGRALGFWHWVIANPQIPLIITEGAKKAGALISAHYIAIALPGIYNGYRQPKDKHGKKTGKPYLIPQLKAFCQKGREIIFCFDNDVKSTTVKNVDRAIATTGKIFVENGCQVSRIRWRFPEKGVDDLLMVRGSKCFDFIFQKRSPLPKSDLLDLLDLAKYKPLKVNKQYLDNTLVLPKTAQLIGIKSHKGSNKTGYLAQIAQQAIYQGQPVLVLTHRIQLTKELCGRFGIDHIDEVRNSDTAGVLGYGFCIDSLHINSQARFNPHNWDNAILILDEVEQTIWHALNSSTCQANRVAIIDNLRMLLKNIVETGGKIYLSDADLSSISIDYILKLIGFSVETWIVENNYVHRSAKRKLFRYSGNDPSGLFSELVKSIEAGQKALVQTTGQKVRSKWGTINIESYLNQKFPELNIIRIDGESVADPNHAAYGCMANLNSLLTNYDVAIASPVIETGVSIDLRNHFDAVWAIAYGVQSVDAVCQTVARVRDDIPRHIWARKTAKQNAVGNGSTHIHSLLNSENRKALANIRLLHQAGITTKVESLELNFSPDSLLTWVKRACIVNLGKANYRTEIIAKLLEEGYELSIPTEKLAAQTLIKEDLKNNCQKSYYAYSKAVSEVKIPNDQELLTLHAKRAKTQAERLCERKGDLSKKYGVEVTPKLVESDDKGLYPQLQLHYYLSVGKAKLAERDEDSLYQLSQQGNGKVFAPDLNKKQLSAKIKALRIINIQQFFDSEAEFSKDSLFKWFNDLLIPLRFDLKSILGVTINPGRDSPIAVAQRFLKQMGLKLEFKRWRGDRKNKRRIYKGCNLNPDRRSQIFDYWLSNE